MGSKPRPVLAWYFAPENRRLRYGDGRLVEAGVTHEVSRDKPLTPCLYGLHASKRAIDALEYAPGPVVARVRLYPPFAEQDDKLCAYRREYLWVADATETLRKFARLCALDVIDKWDAPDIVRRYLETGDESIRAAARDAAWSAAPRDAARAAARSATWSATWGAARSAAWSAARDAARAAAPLDAAWDAAWDDQNKRLHKMLMELKP